MPSGPPQNEVGALAAASGKIYCPVVAGDRLYQGELIEGLMEWAPGYDDTNHELVVGAQAHLHTLALVVSQDCDLEQDWSKRKPSDWIETDLRSVLLCPAFPADRLRDQQQLTSRRWETVRQNKDERYAYLAEIEQGLDAAGEGHPAILLDLTNYFAVRTTELYRQLRSAGANAPRRRSRLETPWREHMQCRFAAFLGRIGLPRDHFIPENRKAQLTGPAAPPG